MFLRKYITDSVNSVSNYLYPEQFEGKLEAALDALNVELQKHMGSADLYEFAMNFDLETAQSNLAAFLSSDAYKKFEAEWSEKPGLSIVDPALEVAKFPKDRIIFQSKYAEDIRALTIAYQSSREKGLHMQLSVDFSDEQVKRFELIKENDLSYMKNETLKEMQSDLETINRDLRTDKARLPLINTFNTKWENQFRLSVVVSVEEGSMQPNNMLVKVEDAHGLCNIERNGKDFYFDKQDLAPYGSAAMSLAIAEKPESLLTVEGAKGFARRNMFALSATTAALAVAATTVAAVAYTRRSPGKS